MSDFAIVMLLGAGWIVLAVAGRFQERKDGEAVIKQAQDIQRMQSMTRHGYGRSWSLWVRDRRDL